MPNKHFNVFIQMFKTCFERNVDSHAIVKNNKRFLVPFTGLLPMDSMTARNLTLTKSIDLATCTHLCACVFNSMHFYHTWKFICPPQSH